MLFLQISTKSAKLKVPCQKGLKDALLRKSGWPTLSQIPKRKGVELEWINFLGDF
jgi:hypothetical protein